MHSHGCAEGLRERLRKRDRTRHRQESYEIDPAGAVRHGVALTYAYRGDRNRALGWLERAYRQKDAGLPEIVGEPLFGNLAGNPDYKAFLRKMNLPEHGGFVRRQ